MKNIERQLPFVSQSSPPLFRVANKLLPQLNSPNQKQNRISPMKDNNIKNQDRYIMKMKQQMETAIRKENLFKGQQIQRGFTNQYIVSGMYQDGSLQAHQIRLEQIKLAQEKAARNIVKHQKKEQMLKLLKIEYGIPEVSLIDLNFKDEATILAKLKKSHINYKHKRAAIKIQATAKMYMIRKRYKALMKKIALLRFKRAWRKIKDKACQQVQKFMRGYLVQKREGKQFVAYKNKLRKQEAAKLLLYRKTSAQVKIAYEWRKYWRNLMFAWIRGIQQRIGPILLQGYVKRIKTAYLRWKQKRFFQNIIVSPAESQRKTIANVVSEAIQHMKQLDMVKIKLAVKQKRLNSLHRQLSTDFQIKTNEKNKLQQSQGKLRESCPATNPKKMWAVRVLPSNMSTVDSSKRINKFDRTATLLQPSVSSWHLEDLESLVSDFDKHYMHATKIQTSNLRMKRTFSELRLKRQNHQLNNEQSSKAKSELERLKAQKINKRGFSFETMSILEMQVYMQAERKRKEEKMEKRRKKAKAKAQAEAMKNGKANVGKLGGGQGARGNGYNVGAQDGVMMRQDESDDDG